MSRHTESRRYRQERLRTSPGQQGAACDGGRAKSGASIAHPSLRRALMTLSAAGVLVAALVGATAPSAAAFRYVQLTIHTQAPNANDPIHPLHIEWTMTCADIGGPGGDSGKTKTSGTQQMRTTVLHPCNRQRLTFKFKVSADGRFDHYDFIGFVDNPLFTGRPGMTLEWELPPATSSYTLKQRTIFSDWPGWDEGEVRAAKGPGYPYLHFQAKRDDDSARHKRFELWIWYDENSWKR
jgi:hypothetical protein